MIDIGYQIISNDPDSDAAEPGDKVIITGAPEVDVADTVSEVKSFKGFTRGNGSTIMD